MSTKAPNPVDRYVGSRVRMRRIMLGMSQEKLGEALGLTFQQVQKYEKGTNRVGASRLQQISDILQVPVSFLFEGAPVESGVDYTNGKPPAPDYVSGVPCNDRGHRADARLHPDRRQPHAPLDRRTGRADRQYKSRQRRRQQSLLKLRPPAFFDGFLPRLSIRLKTLSCATHYGCAIIHTRAA